VTHAAKLLHCHSRCCRRRVLADAAWAQIFSSYQCRDGAQFVVAFYQGDKAAHLQLDGKAVTLPKRVAARGTRYAKGDITLRMMKTSTTLQRGKRMSECTAR
jgi:membrane-bound inhibitor of C-type lysozyme